MDKKSTFFTFLISFMLVSCATGVKDKTPQEKKAELYYSHGTAKLLSKNYTEALELLLQAEELTPNESKVHNNLGMTYFFKDRVRQAEKHLQKALDLDDKNSDARNNLAALYFKQGRLELAKKHYKQVLQNLVYKHQYRTHYNLALIYLKKGRKQIATKHLKLSLQEKADYCPSHFQMGRLFDERGNLDKALESFQEAIQGTCYEQPAAHLQIAKIYRKMGKETKARAKFTEIQEKFLNSSYAIIAGRELAKPAPRNSGIDNEMLEDELWKRELRYKFEQLQQQEAKLENSETTQTPKF